VESITARKIKEKDPKIIFSSIFLSINDIYYSKLKAPSKLIERLKLSRIEKGR
jgi:hypothetical protein